MRNVWSSSTRLQVCRVLWRRSGHEVLGGWMVNDECGRALLRLQQKARGQPHAYVLFRFEQCKQFCLVFQVWASRVAKRVARTAILLMKQVTDVRRVVAGNAQLDSHQPVMELRQGFGGFHAQAMQV